MSDLRQAVPDFLAIRHALGFQLRGYDRLLAAKETARCASAPHGAGESVPGCVSQARQSLGRWSRRRTRCRGGEQ